MLRKTSVLRASEPRNTSSMAINLSYDIEPLGALHITKTNGENSRKKKKRLWSRSGLSSYISCGMLTSRSMSKKGWMVSREMCKLLACWKEMVLPTESSGPSNTLPMQVTHPKSSRLSCHTLEIRNLWFNNYH